MTDGSFVNSLKVGGVGSVGAWLKGVGQEGWGRAHGQCESVAEGGGSAVQGGQGGQESLASYTGGSRGEAWDSAVGKSTAGWSLPSAFQEASPVGAWLRVGGWGSVGARTGLGGGCVGRGEGWGSMGDRVQGGAVLR